MTDMKARIEKAAAYFNALPAEEQEAMLRRQRESWVRGEMGMGSDRDEAEYRASMRTAYLNQKDSE